MKSCYLVPALVRFTASALRMDAQPAEAPTWIQWSKVDGGNNHYYALTPWATNWAVAEKVAESWGGTLATVTSSNEQNFINTTFLTGKFEHLPLWIGLVSSPVKKGFSKRLGWGGLDVQIGYHTKVNFEWVTGEPFSYSNWKPGEPSNTPPGENYVAINWENSDDPPRGVIGDWNDTPLNGTTNYGGKTDGPYFGLVERDTNPSLPLKQGSKMHFAYFYLLPVVPLGLLYFTRRKRAQSHSSAAKSEA